MICPDEATFLRLQNNTLSREELQALHEHLDVCPQCLELASLLDDVQADAPSRAAPQEDPRASDTFAPSAITPTSREQLDRNRKLLLLAQAILGMSHLAWWVVTARLTASGATSQSVHSHYTSALALYSNYWGPLGTLLVIPGWWLSFNRRRIGRVLAALHAGLSLPTVVLAPLAFTVLYGISRLRPGQNR